jgi:hypothetical protein
MAPAQNTYTGHLHTCRVKNSTPMLPGLGSMLCIVQHGELGCGDKHANHMFSCCWNEAHEALRLMQGTKAGSCPPPKTALHCGPRASL